MFVQVTISQIVWRFHGTVARRCAHISSDFLVIQVGEITLEKCAHHGVQRYTLSRGQNKHGKFIRAPERIKNLK